jgi:Flp pilus assembly protein TadD
MSKIFPFLLLLALTSCGGRETSFNEPPPPRLADWKPSLHLADTSLAGGLPGMALEVTDELLADNPRDVDALTRRAAALMQLGRRREAEVSYRRALAVNGDEPAALLGLGRLRLADDPAAAEALFAQAATHDPHDSAALNDLGVSRDLQGHHAAAQLAYRQALAAEPTSAAAQANLGLSVALSGDPAAAERLLRPLAAEPGATPTIRHDLAMALALGGKAREAASLLARDLPPEEVRSTLAGFQQLQQ